MSTQDDSIDIAPVRSELLSAARFLKLVKENPGIIKSSEIVYPTPGARSFGGFRVVYSRPVYRPALKRARG